MFPWIERFLKSDRTYIIPNGAGVAFGSLFFCLLFAGAALNRPLLQLIGFMIAIPYLSAMVQSNNNLKDVKLRILESPLAPAGTPIEARMVLEHHGRTPSRRILIGIRGGSSSQRRMIKRITPGEPVEILVPIGSFSRGVHRVPEIQISSGFPIGMFHTWKRFRPETQIWIHPTPSGEILWKKIQPNQDESRLEYKEHRRVNPGDLSSRIDWKRFARDKKQLFRVYDVDPSKKVVLSWEEVRHLPIEKALSQMARWLLDVERGGVDAIIEAPFTSGNVTASSIRKHLKALACYGESS